MVEQTENEVTMEITEHIMSLVKNYLTMLSESDSHMATEERNNERTIAHNRLIGEFNQAGYGIPHRAQIRQLARYIYCNNVRNLEDRPSEQAFLMFRKLGTRELCLVIPFDEQVEEKVIDLYEPVWVELKSVIKEDRNDKTVPFEARDNRVATPA